MRGGLTPASFAEKGETINPMVDQVRQLIEPWLSAERLELDDLEMVGSGKGRTLRVLVDHPDGVNLDRLTEVSNGIGRLLDDLPDLQSAYQLEVSSPGLERKLRRPEHFAKSIGRQVNVKARIDGETRVAKGELTEAGESTFVVETESGQQAFAYDTVTSARTVFKWQAQSKPGKK